METKDLYSEKYEILMKEFKDDTNGQRAVLCFWTGRINSVKMTVLFKEINKFSAIPIQLLGLDEAQAGIKIAQRNIHNLRYADDTTLTAESENERVS